MDEMEKMDKQSFERMIAAYERDPQMMAYEIDGHYLDGDVEGVGKDSDLALQWYHRVLEAPQVVPHYFDYPALALFQIGRVYFERGEYETAVQYLMQSSAEPSDQVSLLARCYLQGLGVPQDVAKGEELLEHGRCISVAYLAGLYERGELLPKDEKRAAALYVKAFRMAVDGDSEVDFFAVFDKVDEIADGGNLEAQVALGTYFLTKPDSMWCCTAVTKAQNNWPCGAYWMLRAHEHGYTEAENALTMFEEEGYDAGTAQRSAAVYARERKLRRGLDAATCARAEAYLKGYGPRYLNEEEVVPQAAELGNAEAQFAMAKAAFSREDTVRGIDFMTRAARQGHEGACAALRERGIPLEDPPLPIPPEGELPEAAQQGLWYRRTVFVGGNRRVRRICFATGYMGHGGSNNSPYEDDKTWSIRPEEMDGQPPYEVFGLRLTAVVNDIAYFVRGTHIYKVTFGHGYADSYEVTYDTYQRNSIRLSDEE